MSTTNHTTNYELSQYIGTDVTSYLSNYNSDMFKIDAQMKVNATAAASAQSDASAAVSAATAAASSASAAVSTANAANTAAEAAQTAATAAQTAAGTAQTDAAAALRASASNTIGNLAPAYDSTLTYAVGDLVTYVDTETNQGKLYKCIIPIADPEEFNINKWDDVTTSEVYAQPKKSFAYTAPSDTTLASALDDLFDVLVVDTTKSYSLTIIKSDVTEHYTPQATNAAQLNFTRALVSNTNNYIVEMLACRRDSPSDGFRATTTTSGTTTITDRSSATITAGTVFRVDEL